MEDWFKQKELTLEDQWRGIILFGRNVASYKFALAKALFDLKPKAGQLLKMDELALPYALHLAEHLKHSDKQITSASSKFLDGCRRYNQDQDTNALIEQTVRLGFSNVIDAFHVVGKSDIPQRFYIDERKRNDGIRTTDEFDQLQRGTQSDNLNAEVESRWRLVETAWDLGMTRSLVSVDYDPATELLFTLDRSKRRKSVTGSRGALNGYQGNPPIFSWGQK